MRFAIVGMPSTGKTTLFNLLTGADEPAGIYSEPGLKAGVASLPDDRLDGLAETVGAKKRNHASLECADVTGLVKREGAGLTTSPAVLAKVREFDALAVVARGDGAASDARELETELALGDLAMVERRITRLEKPRPKPAAEREKDEKEIELLLRLRQKLEGGRSCRELALSEDEEKLVRSFQFLGLKKKLLVINCDEAGDLAGGLKANLKLEAELNGLDESERAEFMEGLGIEGTFTERFAEKAVEAMELARFFTVVSGDVRSWLLPRGGTTLDAAAAIHTDMARAFIRAEVVPFDELQACGGFQGAKQSGKVRTEGKGYVVQDGDVITIRFSA